jgi:hypothetical protein
VLTRVHLVLGLLAAVPSAAYAQRVDGDRTAISLAAAMGRSTLSADTRRVRFFSGGLTHLTVRVEHAITRSVTARIGIGRSVRSSQYVVVDGPPSPLFDLDVVTTDAMVGVKYTVMERRLWAVHASAEAGRSFVQSATVWPVITGAGGVELITNPGEWSLMPGVEVSAFKSRRLSAAIAYRYGLGDVLKDARSRTRVLEYRAGVAVLRF